MTRGVVCVCVCACVCMMSAGPVTASGRMYPSEMPAMRAARTTARGDYGILWSAWEAFTSWLDEHIPKLDSASWKTAADFYEWYRIGPAVSESPSDWETDLIRPLAPA